MSPSASDHTQEQLLEQCILALENGDEAAVAALLAEHPDHAASVRAQLDRLATIGILHARRPGSAIPERLGEFRLLRQLGRGGMGVVYLAEQESLRRRVALKLVHPEHLFFPGARERFRREVLAVARLAHPGIVPIFTCGEAEGVPFYAMEYVPGASLAELLKEMSGTAPAALDAAAMRAALERLLRGRGEAAEVADVPLFHGSWVRACCRIVQLAAEAVQHAHEQGVLHRDLKPSNVMLTRDGSVRLIDFGLASAHGEQRLTRSGAAFGSMPYMAPEQVRGDFDAVDRRTDVYTLGVTLYELLTLTLPHGDGSGTTRDRILAGACEGPARHNAQVHPDAEAICMLAMDPDPARRYAGAQELAADLGAFLAGRPVRARRLPALVRVQRWAGRHPSQATALLALLVLVVGGPVAFAVVERSAQGRIVSEQERTEQQLEAALRTMDQMLVRSVAARLAEQPGTAAQQRQLLEDARQLQEKLLADRTGDASPRIREQRARTSNRVGQLREQLGDLSGAITMLEGARGELEQLLSQSERPQVLRRELADCTATLASAYGRSDRVDDQVAALSASCRQLELLLEQRPELVAELRVALGQRRLDLAVAYGRLRRSSESSALLDAIERELAPELMPASREQQEEWLLLRANAVDARGVQKAREGDTAAAETCFAQAVQRSEGLAASTSFEVRAARAGYLERLALIAQQRRQWRQSLPRLDRAIEAYETLAREQPEVARWRSACSVLLGTRADCHRHLGDQAGADADRARGIELIEGVVAAFPEEASHRMRLAIALAEGGDALSERGDHAGALADFRRAIGQFELLLQRRPDDEQYLANLVAALGNCAQAEFASGDVGAARATMTRAVELCRPRRGGENQRMLIELLGHASDLALRQGDVELARALMTEAEQRASAWLAEREDDPVRQVTSVLTAVNAGTMYLTLQEHEAATTAWTEALPVARAANGRAGPMGRKLLALLLLRLCDVCVRDGRLPEAREWFQKAIAETAVKRSEMERYDPVPALFDRPDFQDLLQPAKGDKE